MYPTSPAFFNGWHFPHHVRLLAEWPNVIGFYAHDFGNPVTALQDCPGSLSTTTGLHPIASPSAPWSTHCHQPQSASASRPRRLRSLGPYVRRSIGLSLFNRVPWPVAQSGTNPLRRSDHRMVVWSCEHPNPHADCPPLAGSAVFQVFVTRLPSHPTRRWTFTINRRRYLQTDSCPWLQKPRTSTIFTTSYSSSRMPASVGVCDTCLHSTDRRHIHIQPLRDAC